MTITTITGPTILTADGLYFDFLAPNPQAVTINAIARGLANTCRFAGQCDRFYSVAEHSIWVSRLVPPEFALEGLLHDAAEAFIGDMPTPLKEMLPDYKVVEQRIERAVLGMFGIAGLPSEVKHADRVMLKTVQLQLMKNHHAWRWTEGVEPAEIMLEILSPEDAYLDFMNRWDELT